MERDIQFLHREAVMDLQREMIEEDCLVSFEEEPILNLPYGLLSIFCLFVLLRDRLEDVLLFALVSVAGLNH